MDFSFETKFSEKFIELAYTTLIAWNMNQRAAKLSDFNTFKRSLLQNKQLIQSLEPYKIQNLSNSNDLIGTLKLLFDNLQLVADGKPKLVTFSKTLHYFLPDLLMPIDRAYTITYFYNSTNIPKAAEQQFQIYWDVFEQFISLATQYNFESHKDISWNRNIPKIIDNIIIAFIQTKGKNSAQ